MPLENTPGASARNAFELNSRHSRMQEARWPEQYTPSETSSLKLYTPSYTYAKHDAREMPIAVAIALVLSAMLDPDSARGV